MKIKVVFQMAKNSFYNLCNNTKNCVSMNECTLVDVTYIASDKKIEK